MTENLINYLDQRTISATMADDLTKSFLTTTKEEKRIEDIQDERYSHFLTNQKSRFSLAISRNEVITLEFHPAGNRVAYSRVDGSLNIWKFSSNDGKFSKNAQYTYVRNCINSEKIATDLSWNPQELDHLAAASNSNEILIWSHDDTNKTVAKLKTLVVKGSKTKISRCLYDPTGNWLLGTTKQELLYLFDTQNEYELESTFNLWERLGYQSSIASLTWNNSGSNIILGLRNGKIIVLEFKQDIVNDEITFDIVLEINAHRNSINNIKVDPCGNYIMAGSTDGTCSIWDTRTLCCIHVITELNAAIVSLDVDHLGKILSICTGDDCLYFYSIPDFQLIEKTDIPSLNSDAVIKFHPNRSWYILSSKGDTLRNHISTVDDELKNWYSIYEKNLGVIRNNRQSQSAGSKPYPQQSNRNADRHYDNNKISKDKHRNNGRKNDNMSRQHTRYYND